MAGKAQVTAKINADASGLQKTLGGVKKSFAGFAADIGRKMKAAAIAGMAGAAAGVTAALKNGFDQKVMLEQSETLMKSLLGSADKAREAMAMLGAEAKENPIFGKKSMVEAGAALANFADGSTEKLKGLVETSQLLSVLNPAQGLEGAAYALKEALGGDYVSLAERFNISKSTIRSMKEAGLEGKKLVDAILSQQGVTQDTLGDMGNTMGGQMAKVRAMWDDISLKLVEGFWPRIQATAEEFMGWLMENKDQIIEVVTTATEVAIKLFQWAMSAITWIKNAVEQLGAFFGGWWATISANFTVGNFVRWIGELLAAGVSVAQSWLSSLIAWALGKVKELSPRLFSMFGGDKVIKGFEDQAGMHMDRAKNLATGVAEGTGIAEGRRQADLVREQQAAEASKSKAAATIRLDFQGMNGLPRAMAAT